MHQIARWPQEHNVPIFLRTGKRMAERRSEIVVEFADLPCSLFPDTPRQPVNRLVLRLQPEEHVQLQMMAKEPGSGMRLRPVHLDLDLQSAFTERRAEAYERLLIDVIKGRLTHFMRRDELEAAWAWIDPIQQGWAALGEAPRPYAAGGWGPAAASSLLTVVAMAALGLQTDIRAVARAGGRVVAAVILSLGALVVLALALIRLLGL